MTKSVSNEGALPGFVVAPRLVRLSAIWKRNYVLPLACLLAGLLLPVMFAQSDLGLKNEDSFEYVTGGLSLLRGNGYKALSGRTQTVFPPGFPLTIAAGAAFLSDGVRSAKAVSWLSSGISVLLVFLLARRWFGTPQALVAALFFATIPLRVWLAQQALSESLYVMLILLALWMFSESRRITQSIGLGLVLGWAYLTRPEAMILILILLSIMLARFVRTPEGGRHMVACIAGLIIVILPYVLWLSIQVGHFAITGKAGGEVAHGMQRVQGKRDVEMRTLSKDDSAIVIEAASPGLRELILHCVRNLGPLKNSLLVNTGVQPIAGGLLLLGLLEVFKRALQGRLWQFLLLQLFFALHLLLYLPFWIDSRFLYPGMVALCVWMAVGAIALFKWIREGWEEPGRATAFAGVTVTIFVLSIVGSFAGKLHSTRIIDDKTRASQEMARTLNQLPVRSIGGVIGEYPGIAFFAGIHHQWMPYCDLDQLRRFASLNNAPFVAFSESETLTPATAKLLSGNYGPGEAQLLAKVHYGNQDFQMFVLSPVVDGR